MLSRTSDSQGMWPSKGRWLRNPIPWKDGQYRLSVEQRMEESELNIYTVALLTLHDFRPVRRKARLDLCPVPDCSVAIYFLHIQRCFPQLLWRQARVGTIWWHSWPAETTAYCAAQDHLCLLVLPSLPLSTCFPTLSCITEKFTGCLTSFFSLHSG